MQSKDLYQSSISICFNQEEQKLFSILVDSIYPEIANPIETTRVQLEVDTDFHRMCIDIKISSNSLSQLRALVNSIMYLAYAVLATLDVIKARTQEVK